MTCEFCGTEYVPSVPRRGPISKYCSVKCRHKAKHVTFKAHIGKCLLCGGDMVGRADRKYCDTCRHIGRYVIAGTRRDFPEYSCANCGNLFKPKTRQNRFCSCDCVQAHNTKTQGIGPHVCLECGAEFKHRRSSRQANRYCSRLCAVKAGRNRERASGRRTMVPCVPRGAHHEDRARTYGGIVEKVDVLGVFERDDWVCGICGQPVDKHLSWPDPMSPSLDHVIPLSKGGGHTRDNVQCAHLRCNSAKRDRLAA